MTLPVINCIAVRNAYICAFLTVVLIAVIFLAQTSAVADSSYRIAVINSPMQSTNTVPVSIISSLRKSGLNATLVTVDQIVSTEFSSNTWQCLIVVDSPHFPADATENIKRFVRAGGDLVLLGGRAFSNPVKYIQGKWYSRAQLANLAANIKPEKTILSMESSDTIKWTRYTNHPERPTGISYVKGKFGSALSADIKGFKPWDWDMHATPLDKLIPADHNVISFWARRASGKCPKAFVQLDEKDGTRWKIVIDLTENWKFYSFDENSFSIVDANDRVQRPGGHLKLSDAATFGFGLAGEAGLDAEADCSIQIDEVATARLPVAEKIGATLEDTVNVFGNDPSDFISDGSSVRAYTGQNVIDRKLSCNGKYTGPSAFAYALANRSEYVPLLSTHDKYGRRRGWAAGLLVNYNGEFKGSKWLIYGINEPDFYRTRAFNASLAQALISMSDKDLVKWGKSNNDKRRASMLKRTGKIKTGFVRISSDGKHLLDINGKRLFLTGINYLGYFDRICYFDKASFDPVLIESDFRRAHDFGVNSMRIWIGDFRDNPRARETLLALARKYHIYLLIHMACWAKNVEEIGEQARSFAQAYKDESMVIGFDLRNEPQFGEIAGLRKNGEPSPLMKLHAYSKFPGSYDKEQVDNWVKTRPDWPRISAEFKTQEELQDIYAAFSIIGKDYDRWGWPQSTKALEAYASLPDSDPWKQVFAATNETFSNWITPQVDAIKLVSKRFLVTVGYDHPMVCLPTNSQLDFVSFHEYGHSPVGRRPDPRYRTQDIPSLAKIWPNKPITLGEFGYSNGDPVIVTDEYASSVAEMAHYLASLANGQDGCMKWQLNDWPIPTQRVMANWVAPSGYSENEAYGMFHYDGTPTARPKPIAYGIKMLNTYVSKGKLTGSITMFDDKSSVYAGYAFKGRNTLIVGGTTYKSQTLSFTAEHPTNVMLMWDANGLKVSATSDVEVVLQPASIMKINPKSAKIVSGRHGLVQSNRLGLKVLLLSGETILIR